MSETRASPAPETIPAPRRWDIVVRASHWLIVGAILLNALVTEEGSGAHIWVGYALAAILTVRLIWGFVGPKEARFSAFPPSPARAVRHVAEIAEGKRTAHRSHNPLGALMVYAIWGTLIVIIGSGIAMAGSPLQTRAGEVEAAAPASDRGEAKEQPEEEGEEEGRSMATAAGEAEEGEQEEGPLTEVHEAAVNLLYLLIVLHIAGIAFETRRSGRQIVMAMLPGRR
ncbi:MAG: cytochrome b/b6 domain-containing protein [Chakrabartia sp.]